MKDERRLSSQWRAVFRARQALSQPSAPPSLQNLENTWKLIEDYYAGHIENAREFRSIGGSSPDTEAPLTVVMGLIGTGWYPPPELLMSLWASWMEYRKAEGSMSLEEAFLGKSKRKAGNYSARISMAMRNAWISTHIDAIQEQSKTSVAAAAETFLRQNPDVDLSVESVVKICREYWPWGGGKARRPKTVQKK